MGRDLKQLLLVHVTRSSIKGKNEHVKNKRYKIKKQTDSLMIKNTVSVMKNSLDEINSKSETAKEKVSNNRKHPKCNTKKKDWIKLIEPQWPMGQ